MKKISFLLLTLTVSSLPTVAQEQEEQNEFIREYELRDNLSYAFHGGFNYLWSGNDDGGFPLLHVRPSIAFSVSKWFSPVVGVRGMAALSNNRSGISADGIKQGYSWQSFDLGVDGLLSLTNMFSHYRESRRWNISAFIGFGGIQTFGFSNPDWNAGERYFKRDACILLQYRVGAIAQWRLSELWDMAVEFNHNLIHDSFDGLVTDHRWDRRSSLYLSFVRRLRNFDDSHQFRYARVDQARLDDAVGQINLLRQQEAAAVAARPNEVLDVNKRQFIVLVSFPSGSTVINKMQEVNVYTVVQSWQRIGRQGMVYISPLDPSESGEAFLKRADVLRSTLSGRYEIPADRIVIEPGAGKLKSTDETTDKVIVYVSESK